MSTSTIQLTPPGFRLEMKPSIMVEWTQIEKIVAFKRDLFTIDQICLRFDLTDGTWVEINEEMDGYKALLESLEFRFSVRPNWWEDVAFPAFATNELTIWSNDRSSASDVATRSADPVHAVKLGLTNPYTSPEASVKVGHTRSNNIWIFAEVLCAAVFFVSIAVLLMWRMSEAISDYELGGVGVGGYTLSAEQLWTTLMLAIASALLGVGICRLMRVLGKSRAR